MKIKELEKGRFFVSDIDEINLNLTLDCGQAFRWRVNENGESEGTAYGRSISICEDKGGIIFSGTTKEDIEKIWTPYFSLDRDNKKIMSVLTKDSLIKEAYETYGSIRILNQEPFETLISFIISSCNNIPRIKGIISKLCESLGERTERDYAFPTPEVLASQTEESLSFLRAGYRAPYILDAARKVAGGEIDLEALKKEDSETAGKTLMTIKGVGRKVADCTMLFSLGFEDTYPKDVHIIRATEKYYPEGIPDFFHPYSGLAQQYIFHYQRMHSK